MASPISLLVVVNLTAMLAITPIPAAAAASSACIPSVPRADAISSSRRRIDERDLLKLRDIGSSSRPGQDPLLGISPDGKRAAFILSQADAEANKYCRAVVVIAIKPNAIPRQIADAGDPIFELVNTRGLQVDYGYPAVEQPIWSPDGHWIAYLKRLDGRTQVWRSKADGSFAEQVSHATSDVDAFRWDTSGTIIYSTRPSIADQEKAIEEEGRTGFLYDDRFVPYAKFRPLIRLPVGPAYFAVDFQTSQGREATKAEADLLSAPEQVITNASFLTHTRSRDGRRAWTEQRNPKELLSPVDLWADTPGGGKVMCDAAPCRGNIMTATRSLWWTNSGKDVVFMARDGWGRSKTSLYRWHPGKAPKLILSTDDSLAGCEPVGDALLCAREASRSPRRLVLISLTTGNSETVYDPNPEFRYLVLGTVERLHWKNDLGFESYGDLVLPPDYHRGSKVPLIVVQYDTRGFLRGGTGDEYPIQALASHGHAVLSVQKAPIYALQKPSPSWTNWLEVEAANVQGWHDRRSMLSTVETGVRIVVDRGIADRTKIGITGLSDGAATAQFALINSSLFAAAAVSSMGGDREALTYGGPALEARRRQEGYPTASDKAETFWKPMSLALNARNYTKPLLMQLADGEYILGLEAYAALKDNGSPIEMIVYPQENHLKYQPAHRLAIYRRNLQWFDFWLLGKENDNPLDPAQYDRWNGMRASSEK